MRYRTPICGCSRARAAWIPEREVTVAVMSPEASFAALKTGAIDGLVQALPHSLVPLRQGTGVLISSNLRERPDFPELVPQVFNGVVTRADLCDKKPTVCSRIVDGLRPRHDLHARPSEGKHRNPSQEHAR